MTTTSSRTVALASAVTFGILLANPPRAAADCAYPGVASGGIYTYIGSEKNFTITLINLTDYLLYNSGTVRAHHWYYVDGYEAPFSAGAHSYTRPVRVVDMNGDGVLEEGVPPFGSVTWRAADPPAAPQHYEGELDLELRGYTDTEGRNLPTPTWPNKLLVYFHPQYPETGTADGRGTWISLRPDETWKWCGYNLVRSGVWTTPRFPGNVSLAQPGEMEMRNITTIANKYVVASLYSTDNLNIVIVVRQTNWVGPANASDCDPAAVMDAYDAKQLDWVENGSDRVPRYSGCNP